MNLASQMLLANTVKVSAEIYSNDECPGWGWGQGGDTISYGSLNRFSGANMDGFWVLKLVLFSVNILVEHSSDFPEFTLFSATQYFTDTFI